MDAVVKTSPSHSQTDEKAVKFRKLAQRRVTQAVKMIRRIGNLSSPNYRSTPEQVAKMFKVLHDELDSVQDQFLPKVRPDEFQFD